MMYEELCPLTFEQAKKLKHKDIIYEIGQYNWDGTARRWRVNGKVKLWVTMPWQIRVPLKHGLYNCSYLTHLNLERFTLVKPPGIGRNGKSL